MIIQGQIITLTKKHEMPLYVHTYGTMQHCEMKIVNTHDPYAVATRKAQASGNASIVLMLFPI